MTTIAAIEDEARQPRKPRLYVRVETEDFDDLTSSIIASSVATVFDLLRLTIKNKEPCGAKVKFKETRNRVTMIVEEFCLAITIFGHLHLTGKKVVERNKPYRTIYEIRLVSTPPQRG